MNLDDNISKSIKAYLDNEMNDIERENFEKEILNNTELADIVSILKKTDRVYSDTDWDLYDGDLNTLKETSNLFKGEAIDTFSKQIRTAEKQYNSNNKKSYKYLFKYATSFAAALLILFVGNYFFNGETSSVDLYNDYYSQKDLPSFTTKSNVSNTLSKAENLFKTKYYNDALELFESIEKDSENFTPNLLVYIAVCNLEIGNYALAHKTLDDLLESNTLDYHKGYWFKALTYLKENNKTKAISILELLTKNEQHFNYKKAKALLEELK